MTDSESTPLQMIKPAATPASSFRILRDAAREANRSLGPLLRARGPLLLGLHLLAFAAEQYFRFSEEVASRRMSESLGLLVTNAGLAVSFDLFWHSLFFVLVVQACSDLMRGTPTSAIDALARHFNSLVIESTRVIARVLFWMPFLLLPAFYHYLRLFFVNFVVVADPRYELGQVSALERSRELSQGRLGLCLTALGVGALSEPILSHLVNQGEIAIWRNPVGALLSLPVTFFVSIWTLIFLFSVFRALTQLHPSTMVPAPECALSPATDS